MATKLPPSLAATDGVQYIIRKQAEIEQRLARCEQAILDAADKIEAMANDLQYPINSIHITREGLREIAAIIRAAVKRHG